jgi:hypothetical protein
MTYSYCYKPKLNLFSLSIIYFLITYKLPDAIDKAILRFDKALKDNNNYIQTRQFKRNCAKQSIKFKEIFKKETNV